MDYDTGIRLDALIAKQDMIIAQLNALINEIQKTQKVGQIKEEPIKKVLKPKMQKKASASRKDEDEDEDEEDEDDEEDEVEEDEVEEDD